jgi:deazaflavin-dependent oxidoreductase (nitroreductase family)
VVQTVAAIIAALIVAGLAVAVLFVIGMRRKSGFVQGPIIWLGKRWFNKVGLRTAGQPGDASGVVRHRGRTSGRTYETPVAVIATDQGFLIALPYGLRSNWLRNVLANGGAVVVHEGREHRVDSPVIVPMHTVETAFAPDQQRMHRIFGVTEALQLRRAASESQASSAAAVTA